MVTGTVMRSVFAVFLVALMLQAQAPAQTCTGLCLQQTTCSGSATTSITGTVYAPNGNDPLPNVTVYIPNDVVQPFPAGVSCPVVGAPPSGSPLVGTTSAVDGTFTLPNAPVGTNIPLVIVSGKWRRQLVVPNVAACTNTALPSATFASSGTQPFAAMPQDQTQGDIPKIAIATGAVDQVECILRKVGLSDSEFTDPTGTGRINLFTGSGGPGARISTSTPTQATLMENASTLSNYDVLMLPCQGTPTGDVVSGVLGTQELANFVGFANAGGRVYSSHYSYVWMNNNPPFNGVANWNGNAGSYANGTATVNTSFTAGNTLAQWLQLTGASTTQGQIAISTLKNDMNGVIAPTQSWLTLNTTGNPVMQMVFDTPIPSAGTTVNQCGRVLYNEYHVEAGSSSPSQSFPAECSATTTMSPQEKLLEYMLFELTDDGGQPALSPTSYDFGPEAVCFSAGVCFPTAPTTFTWTNNSSFTASASVTVAPPFSITSNNCTSVAAGASCTIGVVFTPAVLGLVTGSLTVTSSGNSLTASLTGTGIAGLTISPATLSFGNDDVGKTVTQNITVTSVATGSIMLPVPTFLITGQFALSSNCPTSPAPLTALASCNLTVSFTPTTTGPFTGTLSLNSTNPAYSGVGASLTGTGVDFTLSLNHTSGTVIAGDAVSINAITTPIAGFSNLITLTCTDTISGSTCTPSPTMFTPTAPVSTALAIATTSQYTIIGYGSLGGGRYMWLIALLSGGLLWFARRKMGTIVRSSLVVLLLAAGTLAVSGCTGKAPAQNAVYTGPGTYTYTITATDGFLTHSATYTLTVTAK
jgi:hypothetical protein